MNRKAFAIAAAAVAIILGPSPASADPQPVSDVRLVSTPGPFGNWQPNDGTEPFMAISDNGRYVAFSSGASNLIAGDTNGRMDVFVRDTVLGRTVRVSLGPGEGNLVELVERALPLVGEIQVADVPGRREPGTGQIHHGSSR